MKKIIFILCLLISSYFFNKSQAQTISLSGPAAVTSGELITLTAVNESLTGYVGSMPILGDVSFITSVPSSTYGICSLWETIYYDAGKPNVPGKFNYKVTSNSLVPVQVKLTFSNVAIVNGATASNSNSQLTYNVTINPAPQAALYYNSAVSGSFTKQTCGDNYFAGPAISYTIPANKYSASSQEAANALALGDLNSNGQANANALGTCTSAPISGPNRVCTGDNATFTLGSLPSGITVVSWSTELGAVTNGGQGNSVTVFYSSSTNILKGRVIAHLSNGSSVARTFIYFTCEKSPD